MEHSHPIKQSPNVNNIVSPYYSETALEMVESTQITETKFKEELDLGGLLVVRHAFDALYDGLGEEAIRHVLG